MWSLSMTVTTHVRDGGAGEDTLCVMTRQHVMVVTGRGQNGLAAGLGQPTVRRVASGITNSLFFTWGAQVFSWCEGALRIIAN